MPAADRSNHLVSTEWLADHLEAPDVVVVDASWYLPTMERDGAAEYRAAHIPGAVHFDLDAVKDESNPLPHMLPSPEVFSSAVRRLGIGDGMRIVVYDGLGLFAAPRVWWTFRIFGARDVVILDGGLPKWKAEGRPLTDEPTRRQPAHFTARFDHGMVRDLEDVRRALAAGSHQVVDARPAARFAGEAPEPRPGLRSGHMPGALNVPYANLVVDGRLAEPAAIAAAFSAGGVDLDRPVVTTCGSGVSAAVLWLALETLGHNRLGLYDGSWSEWGGHPETEVVTGPA
ncbi:3-mercaptopyruvate sulfurtransferase [Prosthecomicrobium hirschii]|uniref:3-mercaptopyruvate sulfurtransferase n=1 Tax=Prosthecodimorpha hirschii TaxID=665126 RepID=UPI002220F722|nr:3-mercaptopyruvate sulfurtransferase [Prosthecomicrobium hirschii]MCW1839068.1 3-mercaptopyruvate sulfurtransferase [Prosthecomicrobium hirschii]